jgi:hypothetical protein
MAAMACLVVRYQETGLLRGLIRGLMNGTPDNHIHRQLEEGLMVDTVDYSGPGSSGRAGNGTLLGRRRAAEIIVNVLLPFASAWGQTVGLAEVTARAWDMYKSYPCLATNTVEKHMMMQLSAGHLVNSARRQQGLIHIYRNLCIQGRCKDCMKGVSSDGGWG